MRRLLRSLEQWLALWACFSGAVVPVSQVIGVGADPETDTAPSLGEQLDDILDLVALYERQWRARARHPQLPGL